MVDSGATGPGKYPGYDELHKDWKILSGCESFWPWETQDLLAYLIHPPLHFTFIQSGQYSPVSVIHALQDSSPMVSWGWAKADLHAAECGTVSSLEADVSN